MSPNNGEMIMTNKKGYINNIFIGSLAGGLMGAFMVLFYGSKKAKFRLSPS